MQFTPPLLPSSGINKYLVSKDEDFVIDNFGRVISVSKKFLHRILFTYLKRKNTLYSNFCKIFWK